MAIVNEQDLDWNDILRIAKREQVEVTISWSPEHVELSAQPWKPYEPVCPYNIVNKAVQMEPTVDTAPVVHGYWADDDCCSKCGQYVYHGFMRKYCPNCGAKMDLKTDH